MKIKAERVWNPIYVKGLCTRKEWYTCGNNHEYQEMLNYVSKHKPTPKSLYKVAFDIKSHSNIEESVSYIMDDIEMYCVNTFYYIHDETEVR